MSRDHRKDGRPYYNNRDRNWDRDRDRDRERDRDRADRDHGDYRSRPIRKRSRTPPRRDDDKRRSRSPRKSAKDLIDENILSEISKLPEPSELWDNQFQENAFPAPPPAFPPAEVSYIFIFRNFSMFLQCNLIAKTSHKVSPLLVVVY